MCLWDVKGNHSSIFSSEFQCNCLWKQTFGSICTSVSVLKGLSTRHRNFAFIAFRYMRTQCTFYCFSIKRIRGCKLTPIFFSICCMCAVYPHIHTRRIPISNLWFNVGKLYTKYAPGLLGHQSSIQISNAAIILQKCNEGEHEMTELIPPRCSQNVTAGIKRKRI